MQTPKWFRTSMVRRVEASKVMYKEAADDLVDVAWEMYTDALEEGARRQREYTEGHLKKVRVLDVVTGSSGRLSEIYIPEDHVPTPGNEPVKYRELMKKWKVK